MKGISGPGCRRRRQRLGWSVAQCAKRYGARVKTISAYETAKRPPACYARWIMGDDHRRYGRRSKLWTRREYQFVRDNYRRMSVPEMAARLRRSPGMVQNKKDELGLCKPKHKDGGELDQLIRAKHEQWTDGEIAEAFGCAREVVSWRRRKMGLPNIWAKARGKEIRRKALINQRATLGVRDVAEFHQWCRNRYAKAHGWPEGLRPRQVQILNAIWERGPMTKQELCEFLGVRWNGSRRTLRGQKRGETFISGLIKRGLLVDLGRVYRPGGKGFNQHVYSLSMNIQRKEPAAA